jgi:hypothetical protein
MTPPRPASERRATGRAMRREASRRIHAQVPDAAWRADPIALLATDATARVPELVGARHRRMANSPFDFFRGALCVHEADLARLPASGLELPLCGDAQLRNFGAVLASGDRLVFDLQEMDSTRPGPFEWDLKRLAVSVVLAGRSAGRAEGALAGDVAAAATSYREAVHEMAETPASMRRRLVVNAEDMAGHYAGWGVAWSEVEAEIAPAIGHAATKLRDKRGELLEGDGFRDIAPLLLRETPASARAALPDGAARGLLATYATGLAPERAADLAHHRLDDIAFHASGLANLATRGFALLLRDELEQPMFLLAREAGNAEEAERMVLGRRLLQAVPDPFLGHAAAPGGGHFVLRSWREARLAPGLEHARGAMFTGFSALCGRALGLAHARAGDVQLLAGYVGHSERLDEALTRHATAYADLVEADHAVFTRAVAAGALSRRVPVRNAT